MPQRVPTKPPPRSRHQNDGDGGFNNPRGFSDAAIENKTGLTVMDDAWTTENVPAAAAIATMHVAPKAQPILDTSGKMIAFGYPGVGDEEKVGMVAPPQGAPSSKCKAQRLAQQLAAQGASMPAVYDWSAYHNYAMPFGGAPAFGGFGPPPPGFQAGPAFGAGRGGPMPFGGPQFAPGRF